MLLMQGCQLQGKGKENWWASQRLSTITSSLKTRTRRKIATDNY